MYKNSQTKQRIKNVVHKYSLKLSKTYIFLFTNRGECTNMKKEIFRLRKEGER